MLDWDGALIQWPVSLLKEGNSDAAERWSHEAEIGVMHIQARAHQGLPVSTRH
jgi:hypothetical protein